MASAERGRCRRELRASALAVLSAGIVPSVTSMVIGEPLRMIESLTVFFGPSAAIRRASSCGSATGSPSTAVMTSPLLTPAAAAGEFLLRLRDQRALGAP